MRPETVKHWIDLSAAMGYNALMLYTEDTYEIPGEPYFGYGRGRYSVQEVRELDDYAAAHGVELIPCIQTLAHLNTLKRWPAYEPHFDIDDVLLAGDEAVYALIEKMFDTVTACFRTRTVHIGMDEAHHMCRGRYYDQHGDADRAQVLLEHLNRVAEIGKKHGVRLCMWSDMFFRLACGGEYYAKDVQIDRSVSALIPENIELVYWDYYHSEKSHYDAMFTAHETLKSGTWFAGGLWTWTGFAPHNAFSIATMREAMKACHAKGVENVVMTMWGDNGAECSKFAVLPALFTVSQMAQDIDDVETIHANFEREFGIPFEEFRALDLIGTQNDSAEAIYNPEKYLLYCDPFMGQFDNRVKSGDAAGYADCAARLSRYESHAEYGYLFRSLRTLCAFLSVKADLGIRTRAAYLSGDKKAAKALCTDYDAALERLDAFYAAYEQQWMHENKPQGFDVIDLRIGGQRQRLLHCRDRLLAYAEGRLDRIEELEEPVLDCCCEEKADGQATRAIFWHEIASANVI